MERQETGAVSAVPIAIATSRDRALADEDDGRILAQRRPQSLWKRRCEWDITLGMTTCCVVDYSIGPRW